MKKIDIGCGKEKREGFIGVDLVEEEGVDYVVDVRNGLPFADEEVDEVFTSHFLEHLTGPEGLKLLKECHRVLKKSGIIEVMVPDFLYCVKEFLDAHESKRWGWPAAMIFGLQTHSGEFHKNGFSQDRLRAMMRDSGFDVQALVPVWSHSQKCLLAKGVKVDQHSD